MTWRGLIMGYLHCGATLIRSLEPGTTRYIPYFISFSLARMWDTGDVCNLEAERRRVHNLSQTRKHGDFHLSATVSSRLTPRSKQKQNAKLFGNSSSVPPSWGRSGVINTKTKYLDRDHFGNISRLGRWRLFILDPASLTN